jgi:hypothetical protein
MTDMTSLGTSSPDIPALTPLAHSALAPLMTCWAAVVAVTVVEVVVFCAWAVNDVLATIIAIATTATATPMIP